MKRTKRRQARTWVELIVEEVLNLAELDIASTSRLQARGLLGRIERYAEAGWLKAFPGLGVLYRGSEAADPRETLETLKNETLDLVRCLTTGQPYEIPTFSIEGELSATRSVLMWARLPGNADPLALKVIYACLAAYKERPGLQPVRCPVCQKWMVPIRKDQKQCSVRCSRRADYRKDKDSGRLRDRQARFQLQKRKEALATSRGVPVEWVRAFTKNGKWKLWIDRPRAS